MLWRAEPRPVYSKFDLGRTARRECGSSFYLTPMLTEMSEGAADPLKVGRPLFRGVVTPRLEDELRAELDAAGVVVLVRRRDDAEVVGRRADDRGREVGLVEGVERLEAELHLHALTNE